MEKILLVVCGAAPTQTTLNFACYLANMTRSRLTGFFFEKEHYTSEPALKQVYGMPYVESVTAGGLPEHYLKAERIEDYMRLFEYTCESKGVRASIRYLEDNIVESLINESRFSDLIIADAAVSYISKTQEAPSALLQHLLAAAQCPVIIAPSSFTPVNEVVFCYDGSPSSIFAMKQLTYLLPELGESKATAVQISEEDIPASEKKCITTWMSRHFESSDFVTLKGNTEQALFDYLFKKQQTLVVMGAYGRSIVSRLFKHSHADLLIKTLACPLFITHY